MKKYFRWPTWLILAAIVMAALVPTLPYFHGGKGTTTHAAGNTGTPTITLSTSIVTPFQDIVLTTQGFGAREAVHLRIDSITNTVFASFQSNANGGYSGKIHMPYKDLEQGQHIIIATGQNSRRVTQVSLTFVPHIIISLASSSKAAGWPGTRFTLSGAAFMANEEVNVHWGSSTGAFLGKGITDALGNLFLKLTVPTHAASGNYMIIVVRSHQKPENLASWFQVLAPQRASISGCCLGPKIRLNPYQYEAPGSTIAVIGSGYLAGETVNIYLYTNTNLRASAIADANGSFQASLTLPTTYDQSLSNLYWVYGISADKLQRAKTSFSFINPWISSSSNGQKFGDPMTIIGQGYAVNEKVNIYWNYQQADQILLGTPTAAGDGTFSISLATPSVPHMAYTTIAAIGVISNLQAKTSQFIYPAVLLNPPSSQAKTALQINGGGFSSNETVTVTFSGTTIATLTTDMSGAFTITYMVPATNGPGDATVQAIGSSSGISVLAVFTYPHLFAITPTTGPSNTIILATGHHFGASAAVSIYWYDPTTNSRTPIGGAQTKSDGSFTAQVMAPAGLTIGNTYYVQAFDRNTYPYYLTVQTAFVAQAPCVQCIQLTPNSSIPGASISVQGSNFTAGETVHVFFRQSSTSFVSATVDTLGAFTVGLTVPIIYQKGLSYVDAVSTTGTEHASAEFLFAQPMLWSENPYDSPIYNTPFGFSGSGFAANEQVTFRWNYGTVLGQVKAGTTIAASDGTITTTFVMPSIPYNTQIHLIAIGSMSKIQISMLVSEQNSVTANPNYGPAGTKVQVRGGGFGSSETVTVAYPGNGTTTATTSSKGIFTASFVVPASASLGGSNYGIVVTGNSSGAQGNTDFSVVPKLIITPKTGPSGTQITVTGSHFTPTSQAEIYWFDPGTGQQTYFTAPNISSKGTFVITITAPAGLISGHTYYVQGTDISSGTGGETQFVAQ
ncbi:MAG: hypothetical protein ACJ8AG_01990 [Ktedonobacteraceae bacterium]